MTDIVLRDIDPVLAERIRRVAQARGWDMHQTLLALLEQGLYACESGAQVRLDDRESTALQQAIAALEQVPNDPGFGLIGRASEPTPPPHILDHRLEDVVRKEGEQDEPT